MTGILVIQVMIQRFQSYNRITFCNFLTFSPTKAYRYIKQLSQWVAGWNLMTKIDTFESKTDHRMHHAEPCLG